MSLPSLISISINLVEALIVWVYNNSIDTNWIKVDKIIKPKSKISSYKIKKAFVTLKNKLGDYR